MNTKNITHNTPADFTPTLGNYKELQPFRYWCHKVLPLVYDDSLSYYELLCKIVAFLNDTMEYAETLHVDVTNLRNAYNELQSYVNNYFSNLDVQEEINNKLDNMASNGELYEIIRSYTDPIVNEQNDKISVLKARMDTFTSLPEGSTSGDAELLDIRVGYNGVTYPSAGDSVRGQVGELKSDITQISGKLEIGNNKIALTDSIDARITFLSVNSEYANDIVAFCGDNMLDISTLKKGYYLDTNGDELESGYFCVSEYIPVIPNEEYYFASQSNILDFIDYCGLFYDGNKNVIGTIECHYPLANGKVLTPTNCRYVRLMVLTQNISDSPYFIFNEFDYRNIKSTGINYKKLSEINGVDEIKTYYPRTIIFTWGKSEIQVGYISSPVNNTIFHTPQEYGAIGDGSHDSTNALKNCILKHNNIYIPKGRYVISDTLLFENITNVSIVSDSAELYLADSTNNKPMMSFVGCNNINIRGVHFNGNRENQTLINHGSTALEFSENCACLILEKTKYVVVENCNFYNCQGDGIQIDQLYYPSGDYVSSHTQNVKIHDNVFDKIGRTGVSIVHAKNTEIYNNSFKNITWFSSTIATGVNVESGTGAPTSIDNTVIRNNHFYDCLFGVLVCGVDTRNTYVCGNIITNSVKGEYGFMTSNLPNEVYVADNNIECCVYNVYTNGICNGLKFLRNTLSKAKENPGDIEDGGFNMYFNADVKNILISNNVISESPSTTSIKFVADVNNVQILNNVLIGEQDIHFNEAHDNCVLYNLINGKIVQ